MRPKKFAPRAGSTLAQGLANHSGARRTETPVRPIEAPPLSKCGGPPRSLWEKPFPRLSPKEITKNLSASCVAPLWAPPFIIGAVFSGQITHGGLRAPSARKQLVLSSAQRKGSQNPWRQRGYLFRGHVFSDKISPLRGKIQKWKGDFLQNWLNAFCVLTQGTNPEGPRVKHYGHRIKGGQDPYQELLVTLRTGALKDYRLLENPPEFLAVPL